MENQLKTIVYDYLFNYFGGDTYEERIITGACVQLAIKAYKEGKEIKFAEEPKYNNIFWCDNFKVSFDRENVFVIKKNLIADNLFRLVYGFEKIEAEVIGYTLDYLSPLSENEKEDLPKELREIPCSEPMEVSEDVFKQFIMSHKDDFDITDNINAQVPSVSFI